MNISSGLCFSPSSDEAIIIEGFRRFGKDVLRKFVARGRDTFVPVEEIRPILKQVVSLGFVNGLIDEVHGGLGLKLTTFGMMVEELARESAAFTFTAMNQVFVALLLTKASDAVRDRYLPKVLDFELFGCTAISEPDVGSNVVEVKCRATREGDQYRITGEKTWITNGHYSDFVLCIARTGPEPADLGVFLIDRHEHGYTSRNISKMGLKSCSTAQLFIDGAIVPSINRLTEPGMGLREMVALWAKARPLTGMTSVGVAHAALEHSIRYATERHQHGHAIAGHQLIQSKLAEMATEIDAARLLIFRALDMIDRGQRAESEAAQAKWFAADMAVRVTAKAIGIHGGNGITTEFPLEGLARDAQVLTIPDGTEEILKLIIGRRLTGVRAF